MVILQKFVAFSQNLTFTAPIVQYVYNWNTAVWFYHWQCIVCDKYILPNVQFFTVFQIPLYIFAVYVSTKNLINEINVHIWLSLFN